MHSNEWIGPATLIYFIKQVRNVNPFRIDTLDNGRTVGNVNVHYIVGLLTCNFVIVIVRVSYAIAMSTVFMNYAVIYTQYIYHVLTQVSTALSFSSDRQLPCACLCLCFTPCILSLPSSSPPRYRSHLPPRSICSLIPVFLRCHTHPLTTHTHISTANAWPRFAISPTLTLTDSIVH